MPTSDGFSGATERSSGVVSIASLCKVSVMGAEFTAGFPAITTANRSLSKLGRPVLPLRRGLAKTLSGSLTLFRHPVEGLRDPLKRVSIRGLGAAARLALHHQVSPF